VPVPHAASASPSSAAIRAPRLLGLTSRIRSARSRPPGSSTRTRCPGRAGDPCCGNRDLLVHRQHVFVVAGATGCASVAKAVRELVLIPAAQLVKLRHQRVELRPHEARARARRHCIVGMEHRARQERSVIGHGHILSRGRWGSHAVATASADIPHPIPGRPLRALSRGRFLPWPARIDCMRVPGISVGANALRAELFRLAHGVTAECGVHRRREMHRGTHCGCSGQRQRLAHGPARNSASPLHAGPCRRTRA
jgi:hypothetical protein